MLSGFCHDRVAQVDSSNWDNPILKQENEDKQVQFEGATYRATQQHPCSLSSLPVWMPSQVNFACINAPVAAVLHASVCFCMESMVFLGKLNPSLSVSWKYSIFILCHWSHTNKKLLLIQDQATHSGCEEEGQE